MGHLQSGPLRGVHLPRATYTLIWMLQHPNYLGGINVRKKGLLLVAALLALSGLMAVMAVSEIQVRNKMAFSVVNTQDALIALKGNEAHAAIGYGGLGTSKTLKVNFNAGHGGDYGIQKDSKYTWHELFEVTNNTAKEVEVSITLDDHITEAIKVMAKSDTVESWQQLAGGLDSSSPGSLTFKLLPGHSEWVSMQLKDWDFEKEGGSTFSMHGKKFDKLMILVSAETVTAR